MRLGRHEFPAGAGGFGRSAWRAGRAVPRAAAPSMFLSNSYFRHFARKRKACLGGFEWKIQERLEISGIGQKIIERVHLIAVEKNRKTQQRLNRMSRIHDSGLDPVIGLVVVPKDHGVTAVDRRASENGR